MRVSSFVTTKGDLVRSLRLTFAIVAAIFGLVLFASPASAGVGVSEWITIQDGPDVAEYDSYYNILTVCDETGETERREQF
jgi:hypothetical protein